MSKLHDSIRLFGREFPFTWNCPGTWDNLSAGQLRALMKIQVLKGNTILYSTKAVLILLNIKRSIVRQWLIKRRFNAEYLELPSFLYDQDKFLTKNLIGPYKGMKTIGHWKDLIGRQYFTAEFYYMKFVEDPTEAEWLSKLVACLYIPKHASFENFEVDDHWQLISRWPMEVRLSVLAFYSGSRREWQAANPAIFNRGGTSSGSYGNGLMDLRAQLSNNDVTKGGEVDAIKLFYLFHQLNKSLKDAERAKQ